MSIVVRFSPTALTAKKYDETIRQLKNAGEWPPAGLDYHVCFGSDGNLKVSEIWNSREQFEAFGERLMPILAGAGIQFANPPDIFDVHNIVKGSQLRTAARSRIANRSGRDRLTDRVSPVCQPNRPLLRPMLNVDRLLP